MRITRKQSLPVHIALAGILSLNLVACGEDRTGEFVEQTGDTHWIYDVMKENYLWYKEMPVLNNYSSYFSEPEPFFNSLLSKKDRFSYIEVQDDSQLSATRSSAASVSYGFEFVLYGDITGESKRLFARVLYVLPDSPAETAGLKRGDWIADVGGQYLTEDNYGMLLSGGATTLTLMQLNYEQLDSIYWESEMRRLPIGAARYVEDNPFLVDSVYQLHGHRIAYLMYNSFSTGPDNNPTDKEYGNQMRQIFAAFKSQHPTDFVLDLRYNPGGYLSCAQTLASLLTPQRAFGKVFCSLEFSDKKSKDNESILLSESLTGGNNLDLSKLYVIVGEQTASASESIINGLIPYMGAENIVLVGAKTVGKNVASISYEQAEYGITMHPIVATVYNGLGESDYADGFTPYVELDEFQFIDNYQPLGSTDEILLNTVLHMILYGDDELQMQQATRSVLPMKSPFFNSVSLHRPACLLTKVDV